MNQKPKIHIELTQLDNIIEIFGWLTLLILWSYTLFNYSGLPNTIPTHFDFNGQVDDYGSKLTVLLLPIIGTIVFVGLTILNKFPHIFNYPTEITPENALSKYTIATRMIRYLKFIIIVIFTLIEYMIFSSVKNEASSINFYFLPIMLVLIFIPIIFSIIKLYKK
jgi:uncharacterized membrane protein